MTQNLYQVLNDVYNLLCLQTFETLSIFLPNAENQETNSKTDTKHGDIY